MRVRIHLWVLPALVLWTGPAFMPNAIADQEPEPAASADPALRPVLDAVARYLRTDLEQWRYRRTVSYRDTVRVDRHEPTLPGAEHWQLETVDGREPTEEEWEEYRDDRSDHGGERGERLAGDYVSSILVLDSLSREPSPPGVEQWSFALQSPDGRFKRSYEKLRGDLRLARDELGVFVDRVRVWNEEPFNPFFGVRMNRLFLDFRFVAREDGVFPVTVEAELDGKAFWIREIGRRFSIRMEDFERVLPAPPSGREADATP